MEHLDGILKFVDRELGAIEGNGKFKSREEIDSVYKLVDIAKDIYCIWEYESDEGDEASYDGGSYRGGRSYRGSYECGGSYARGRGRGARRYADGRYAPYSREGGSMRSYRGDYSRDGGRQEYIENLREMMETAPDDQTRQNIQRMIQQMEQG